MAQLLEEKREKNSRRKGKSALLQRVGNGSEGKLKEMAR